MEKRASKSEFFQERIALLSYFISYGYLTENDVEEAYRNPELSWKERVSAIENKYHIVDMCCIFNDRIGELIPRYIYAVKNKELLPKDELEVFWGVREWCNQRLKEILSRNITILDFSDKFWIYFILTYSGIINVENQNKYSDREEYDRSCFLPEYSAKLFDFSKEEMDYSAQKAKAIGIQEPFICFSNRDSAYLNSIYPQADWSYHDYRDSHIENYEMMTSAFREKSIGAIRMGKAVEHRAEFDNCVDFASDYYDEMLDIYLMSRCKMFIGDESGINVLPRALNKPVVTANLASITGYGGIPLREDNIFIFKKFYDTKNERMLNLREMCNVMNECRYDTDEFLKRSIKLVEDTPEEIRDAAMEMNDYLDGIESYDSEGENLQKKASYILQEYFDKLNLGSNETLVGKIGKKYLKDNSFLLE